MQFFFVEYISRHNFMITYIMPSLFVSVSEHSVYQKYRIFHHICSDNWILYILKGLYRIKKFVIFDFFGPYLMGIYNSLIKWNIFQFTQKSGFTISSQKKVCSELRWIDDYITKFISHFRIFITTMIMIFSDGLTHGLWESLWHISKKDKLP